MGVAAAVPKKSRKVENKGKKEKRKKERGEPSMYGKPVSHPVGAHTPLYQHTLLEFCWKIFARNQHFKLRFCSSDIGVRTTNT